MLKWNNLNDIKYLHFVPSEDEKSIYIDVPIGTIMYKGNMSCIINIGDYITLKPADKNSYSLKSEFYGVLTFLSNPWIHNSRILFSDIESDLLYIDTSMTNIIEFTNYVKNMNDKIEIKQIKEKLLRKKRKQDLEKIALQELMDEGDIFPEANKRPPIPKEVVDAVWRRDGGKCVYCGSTENLQLDHIIPFSKGGATTVENLQLLCQKCNLQKSNKIG